MYIIIASLSLLFLFFILLVIKNRKISTLEKKVQKNIATEEKIINLSFPLFFKNPQGKITKQNRAFDIKFGDYKKDALKVLATLPKGEHTLKLPCDNGIEKNLSIHVREDMGIIIDIDKTKQDQESLIAKKEHFELALKGSGEGSWEWDVKTDTITLSKRALELLEYEEGEEKPSTLSQWINLVSAYDLAQVNEAFARHIQGLTPSIFVKHRLKVSSSLKWLLIKGKALKHENSQIQKVYGTIVDITKTEAQVKETKRQKELFTTFMDSLPALAFIKSKEGKYLYINTYYERLLGFKKWKNKTVSEIFDERLSNSIKESDREAFYEGIQKHEETIPDESGEKHLFQTYKFPIDTSDIKVLCGFGLDITKEKLYQERINLYANVFDNTTESIVITDEKAIIIAVNRAFCETTGYSEKELIGKNPRLRQSGRHSKQFYTNFWHELLKNGSWRGEIFNKNKDGSVLPELMNVSAVRDEKGDISNFIAISQSIEKQKIMEESLRRKAHFDVLTNLPNRSLFFDRLEQAMLRSTREGELLALVFLDLDDFKAINDTHGHSAGDIVLKTVAKRLMGCIRDTDTIGRIGGDEFVIVLESLKHPSDINFLAEKIKDEVTKPIPIDKYTCSVGVSMGISISPLHTKNLKELLEFADQSMYVAKEQGKNCYKIYQKD